MRWLGHSRRTSSFPSCQEIVLGEVEITDYLLDWPDPNALSYFQVDVTMFASI